MDDPLVQIAFVVALGVACQVLGPLVRLPPILLLLVAGFVAGWAGAVSTDALLGDLLFPLVSLGVAVVLFEGGLTLDRAELQGGLRKTVRRLLTVGVLVTWVSVALLAFFLLRLPAEVSVLLGALLVVSGPTVVTPLLSFVGPVGRVGTTLKFEGILVDPVGAIIAVLVYQGILASARGDDAGGIVGGFALTVGAGAAVGIAGAVVLALVLRASRGTPSLDAPITLAMVFVALAGADALRAESGLVAVTLMGVVLANQRRIPLHRIEAFKKTLGVLVVSVLFVLLAARVTPADALSVGWRGVVLVAALVLVVRPLAALAATVATTLTWRERLFVGWMGPRGIVAAATASVFALDLERAGVDGADRLVPVTFVVILGTVLVASLTVVPVARLLGVRGEGHDQPAEPADAPPSTGTRG